MKKKIDNYFSKISFSEFGKIFSNFGPFESNPEIAVGVSGGADSLLLVLLLQQWVLKKNGKLTALIVNHNLRSGSMAEIKILKGWLRKYKINYKVFHWVGKKPKTRIQEIARSVRLKMLTDWCFQNGIIHLCLAHNLDDQAETFLIRLSRGSGVYGLSAMAPISVYKHVRLLRPFLFFGKERIILTLEKMKQDWIEDPSNKNTNFQRVRIRNIRSILGEEGIDNNKLSQTSKNLGRAKAAILDNVSSLAAESVSIYPEGYVILHRGKFLKAPEEIRLKLLSHILMCVSGKEFPPRLKNLEKLDRVLCSSRKNFGSTLHSCQIESLKKSIPDNKIIFFREMASIQDKKILLNGKSCIWDNRFQVSCDIKIKNTMIYCTKLGADGLKQVLKFFPDAGGSSIPYKVKLALPSVWAGRSLLSVPHLNFRKLAKNVVFNDSSAAFKPSVSLGMHTTWVV